MWVVLWCGFNDQREAPMHSDLLLKGLVDFLVWPCWTSAVCQSAWVWNWKKSVPLYSKFNFLGRERRHPKPEIASPLFPQWLSSMRSSLGRSVGLLPARATGQRRRRQALSSVSSTPLLTSLSLHFLSSSSVSHVFFWSGSSFDSIHGQGYRACAILIIWRVTMATAFNPRWA